MESRLPVQAVSLSGKQKTKLSIKISLQQFAPLKMCKYEFTSNESEPAQADDIFTCHQSIFDSALQILGLQPLL